MTHLNLWRSVLRTSPLQRAGPARCLSTSSFREKLRFECLAGGGATKALTPADFEGKAVLVVNTASLCGLTPQLKELQMVHRRFQAQGFTVLGVPSNDFGGQEPWEEEKVRGFYEKEHGVTFPLASKTKVLPPDAHAFYTAVAEEFGEDASPRWNFHKYLVDAKGDLVGVFDSPMSPLETELTDAIEEALPAPA